MNLFTDYREKKCGNQPCETFPTNQSYKLNWYVYGTAKKAKSMPQANNQ